MNYTIDPTAGAGEVQPPQAVFTERMPQPAEEDEALRLVRAILARGKPQAPERGTPERPAVPDLPEQSAPGAAHGQPLNAAPEPEAERAPGTALHEPEPAAPAEPGTAFALPVEQTAGDSGTAPGLPEREAAEAAPGVPEEEAPGAAHGQPLNASLEPEAERTPEAALREPEPAAPAESGAAAALSVEQTAGDSGTAPGLPEREAAEAAPGVPEEEAPGAAHGQPLAAGPAAAVQPLHGKLAVLSPLRSWVQELSGVYIALVSALVAGLVTLLKAYGYVWYQGFFSYYGLHCADVGHTLDSGFSMLLFQLVLGLLFYFSLCLFWQGLALFSPEPPQTVLGLFPLEDDPPRRLGVLAALIGAVVNGVCWYIFAGSVLPFLPSLLPLLVLVGLSWLGTLIAYSIVMLLQKRPDKLPALWNLFRNGVAHLWRVLPTLGRWLWRSLSALACWLAKSLAALLRWLWHSLAALLHWLGQSLTAPRRWLAGKLPQAAAWYRAHLVPLGKCFAAWLGRCRAAVCSGCRSLWACLHQKAGAVYARRGQRAPAEKRGGFRLPMDVLAGGLAALLGLVLLGGLAYSQGRMTAHSKRAYLIIQKPEAAYAVIEQGDAFYWALGAAPDAETGTLVLDRAARHAFALEDVLAYEQAFDTVTFAPGP